MFKQNANIAFIRGAPVYAIMQNMGKNAEQINPQVQRLYKAARELKGIEGKSAVARLLNVSPQSLNNWERGREISQSGLIAAQENIGCNVGWLRDGAGDMQGMQAPENSELECAIELLTFFSAASPEGKSKLMTLIRTVAATERIDLPRFAANKA